MELDGRAAIVQRQSLLAAQYQQGIAQKKRQALPRAQGLHGNEVARRNAIRAQAHNQHNYNFVVNTDNKCPAR